MYTGSWVVKGLVGLGTRSFLDSAYPADSFRPKMEQSASTCTLLTSNMEHRQHHKWLGCLSMRKKTVRSLSSSPERHRSSDRMICRSSTTDRRQSNVNIPRLLPAPDGYPYFTLTIKPRSTVFLVYANDWIHQIVLTSLAQGWGLDPRKRRTQGYSDDGAYWIRLRNQPFLDGTGTANRAKLTKTICDCINRLRQIGWDLIASIDLANQYPASTLFFHRRKSDSGPGPGTRRIEFLEKLPCLSVNGSDTLTLIDANENLISCFKRTVIEAYEPGLAKKGSPSNGGGVGCLNLRLKGQPFFSHDRTECIRGRQLILDLVSELDSSGFEPYGTLNLTSGSDSILFSRKISQEKKKFMCISLMLTNKIRLFDAPKNVQEALKTLATRGPWQHGMESMKVEGQRVTRIKFHGHPWNPLATECHWARRFLCHLFKLMAKLGWRCCLSYDLNRHTYNKATFLFSQSMDTENRVVDPSYHVFCLNLSSGSYCQLIDAPIVIRQKFSEIARKTWPKPVTEEPVEVEGVQDWTLHMSPWSWGKFYDPHGRALMTQFIDECSKIGYRVMTGANILTKYDMPNEPYPRDAHCIFFESV